MPLSLPVSEHWVDDVCKIQKWKNVYGVWNVDPRVCLLKNGSRLSRPLARHRRRKGRHCCGRRRRDDDDDDEEEEVPPPAKEASPRQNEAATKRVRKRST